MWKIACAQQGEESKYLKEGWKPFAVVSHDTSYSFYNSTERKGETEHQTTDFIYFRRWESLNP